MKDFLNLPSDICIDLGTANTLVFVRGKGIVVNEPSVVATKYMSGGNYEILAVGNDAKLMVGRTPCNIKAIYPMRDGVIADYKMAEEMIKNFIRKANKNVLFSSRVIICVPYGATAVDRKAIHDSAISAGARKVVLIDEPLAAAIGANLPVELAKGSMIVDIGGGTTEIGIISLGSIAAAKSHNIGGYKMDEAIKEYVSKHFSIKIGDSTAEELKKNIGVAFIDENTEIKECKIRGFDIHEGGPKSVTITSRHIMESLEPLLSSIADAINSMFDMREVTYDLCGDIARDGLVLSGGGALLKGLDEFLARYTKLDVRVADDPLLCVVAGLGKVVDDERQFSAIVDALE
jgi:rod shape-determining protein MreB